MEVPHLVRRFGLEAVIRLFKSNAIELSVDKSAIGIIDPKEGPVDPYALHVTGVRLVQPASMDADFAHLQESFEIPRLSGWRSLRSALRRAIEAAAPDLTQLQKAPMELIHDFNQAVTAPGRVDPYVRASLIRSGIAPGDRAIRFEASKDDKTFGVDTDLETAFGLNANDAGRIVRAAFMGLSTEVSWGHEMRLYHALTPFAEPDAPIFGAHLHHIVQQIHPDTPFRAFERVVEIKGLPNLRDPEVAETINLHHLLDARSSSEAVAFRDWLWTAGTLEDHEIAEQLEYHMASIGGRFSWFLKTPLGRRLRWLTVGGGTFGLGLIDPTAATIAGPVLSYGNTFLLEKIITSRDQPSASPVAFIETHYPSIFESGNTVKRPEDG